jgi:hypothetical protein
LFCAAICSRSLVTNEKSFKLYTMQPVSSGDKG